MEQELKKISNFLWEIPKTGEMKVPGRVYADEGLLQVVRQDKSLDQVRNVAQLPGIVGYSLAMPDIHWGYGFSIGGVAAMDIKRGGIISPGGVGYDINCGVRLLRTDLDAGEIRQKIKSVVDDLFNTIPTGVGSKGAIKKLSDADLRKVMVSGAKWMVEHGFGEEEDLIFTEENGFMKSADSTLVSKRAIERGAPQLGTLGSGNHFLEIGVVEKVFDDRAASAFGLEKGKVTFLIHTGSRGLGHQICDDNLVRMNQSIKKHGLYLPDRQLSCAPFNSDEGQGYYKAMCAAANFAWANRQCIMHLAIRSLSRSLKITRKSVNLRMVYDVAHNIAKIETHTLEGKEIEVCVHRKGATRAFPAGSDQIPEKYSTVGQPVIIPGDMGRYSYVTLGQKKAMDETFGSSCHGAGRVLSRNQAIKASKGRSIDRELKEKGIYVLSKSHATLAEEMSEAYKDAAKVVEVMHESGIATMIARLKPIGVIKG